MPPQRRARSRPPFRLLGAAQTTESVAMADMQTKNPAFVRFYVFKRFTWMLVWIFLSIFQLSQAAPSVGERVDQQTKIWPLAKPIYQQPAAALPKGFLLDAATSEWTRPANLLSANNGQIWLGSDAAGLVIAGELDALTLDAHIELQISSTKQLRLPVIGWPGVALSARSDCKSTLLADLQVNAVYCEQFFDMQQRFQQALLDAFAPRYRITQAGLAQPLNPFKTFENDPALAFLPTEHAQFSQTMQAGKQRFEILLPWAALPPTDRLLLDRIYLRITHCEEDRCIPFLPSYARDLARPDIEVLLAKPMQYQLTQCDLPLWGAVGNTLDKGYFLPSAELVLLESLTLTVPSEAFYRGFNLNHRVPSPGVLKFDNVELASDEYVCGPLTSYRSADGLAFAQSKYRQLQTANNDNDRELHVYLEEGESGALRLHKLDERYALVAEPPVGKVRNDVMAHCGGDTSIGMRVWLLDRARKLGKRARFTKLLEWRAGSHDCWGNYQTFEVSADLMRIVQIETQDHANGEPKVIRTAFCFDVAQLKYVACKKSH